MSSSVHFTDGLEFNNFKYVLSVQPNSIFCLDSLTIGSWSFTHNCLNSIMLNMTNWKFQIGFTEHEFFNNTFLC